MPAYMQFSLKFLKNFANQLVRDFREIQFIKNKEKFLAKTLDFIQEKQEEYEIEGDIFIDGIANFIKGIPLCTLVYRKDDWILIYDFLHNQIFWKYNDVFYKEDIPIAKSTEYIDEPIIPESLKSVFIAMGRM